MIRALPMVNVKRDNKDLWDPTVVSGSTCPAYLVRFKKWCFPVSALFDPIPVAHFLHSSLMIPTQFSFISVVIYYRLLGFALKNCMQLSSGMVKGSWNCFGLSRCKWPYSPYRGAFL